MIEQAEIHEEEQMTLNDFSREQKLHILEGTGYDRSRVPFAPAEQAPCKRFRDNTRNWVTC